MARQKLFPAGLMVLIVVVVLVHQSCSAEDDSHICPASSCGNIHNISYPFRLNGTDPASCGDQRYNLSCENNQAVLYLYDGRYFVLEIDYHYYTIRVVEDSGIRNDNDSFIPRYSLGQYNFSSGDPYAPDHPYSIRCDSCDYLDIYMVFVNCKKQVKSPLYLDISTCFKNGGEVYSSNSFLSHSKRYNYAIADDMSIGDLEESCQIKQMSPLTDQWIPFWPNGSVRYLRCSDFYDAAVVSDFMLSWFQVACDNSTPGNYYCNINDNANYPVQCVPQTAGA
jgi:hypothetical protein